jgi:hypothetical protein
MHEHLRDRIVRKLDALSDERGYQILDFIEFLETKYTDTQRQSQNVFTRFAEAVEDKMRAGRVSTTTIAETMNLMNRAMRVLDGVATAGKNVASDLANTAAKAAEGWTAPPAPGAGAPPVADQPLPTAGMDPTPPPPPHMPTSNEEQK